MRCAFLYILFSYLFVIILFFGPLFWIFWYQCFFLVSTVCQIFYNFIYQIKTDFFLKKQPSKYLKVNCEQFYTYLHWSNKIKSGLEIFCRTADRFSSYNRDYVIGIKNFLNPEWHQNPISGSKVTAILLMGWILPNGGASAGEGLCLQPAQQACLSRPFYALSFFFIHFKEPLLVNLVRQ